MIKLVKGPMFAAKTTSTIFKIKKYIIANKKCIIVKFSKDKRYLNKTDEQLKSENTLTTHDKINFNDCPVIYCELIDKIIDKLMDYDVVAINEAQFYEDLV